MKLKNYCLVLLLLLVSATKNWAQLPQIEHPLIQHQATIGIGDYVSRLVYNSKQDKLLYATVGGDIYEVSPDLSTQPTPNLLFTASDHGITYLQGMAIKDSLLVVCGNYNAFQPLTTGRVSKAILQPNGSWQWSILAETEPYRSADYFDHLFSGIIITQDADSVIWCSGARGDHGEIQDYYGQYPGLRNLPLTSILLAMPASSQNVVLQDDSTFLATQNFVYARGTRNFFDFDYTPDGQLYALENSGDRDDSDEMNRVVQGAHYGFPWKMSTNTNPQSLVPFVPSADKLINHYSRAYKLNFFSEDPTFPLLPVGVTFTAPVVNLGPDADYYREPTTGLVKKASNEGSYLQTFTAHRSPLGLAFDKGTLPQPFSGKGFMLSWSQGADSAGLIYGSDTSIGPFVDPSQDLLLITPAGHGANFDTIQCTALITNFRNPIDLEIVGNYMYIIENRDTDARLFQYVLGEPNNVSTQTIPEAITLFPNPANEYVMLQLSSGFASGEVCLFSLLGGKVFQTSVLNQSQLTISTADLSPGVYVLQVENNQQVRQSFQVVVTH